MTNHLNRRYFFSYNISKYVDKAIAILYNYTWMVNHGIYTDSLVSFKSLNPDYKALRNNLISHRMYSLFPKDMR